MVPVRLSDNGRAKVQKLAEDVGLNRSEALRLAIAFACTHEDGRTVRAFIRKQKALEAAAKEEPRG